MIIIWVEFFQQCNTTPASTQYDELWFMLLRSCMLALVIVNKVLDQRQVLGASSPWVEGKFRYGNFECGGVLAIGGSVEDKEGYYQTAADKYKCANSR